MKLSLIQQYQQTKTFYERCLIGDFKADLDDWVWLLGAADCYAELSILEEHLLNSLPVS